MTNDNKLELAYYGCLVIFFLALVLSFPIFSFYRARATQETVTDKVVRLERVNTEGSSKYLVFGEKEVYQNTDSLWNGKFNSSDFYRDIEPGKTYRFRVYGWRVPFLSWYRNIIAYEQVQ